MLYGENEPPCVRLHPPIFGAEIHDATVQEVPNAGHASNLDNPEFFTGVLSKFLAWVHASLGRAGVSGAAVPSGPRGALA